MGHKGEAHIDHRDGSEEMEDDVNGDDGANDNLDVKSIWFPSPEFEDDELGKRYLHSTYQSRRHFPSGYRDDQDP